MFYQGVILRLSFWIILLRKAWLALCRQGKGRSGPRSLQNEQVCAFYQRMGFTPIMRSNAIYMGQLL